MFDLKAFRNTTFTPREAELKFSALASAGFGDGVIKLRGLTSEEIAKADESAQKGKLLSDLVLKLAESSGKEAAGALLEGIGVSDNVPEMLAKRYEHVCAGVIKPKLDLSDAVKLGDTFPVEFSQLANKIMELTGLGKTAEVKRRGSGKKKK